MKQALETDHREIDGILKRLDAAFEKENLSEIHDLIDFFWARLAMHIRAEHLQLFPAVLEAISSNTPTVNSIARPTLGHAEEVLIVLRAEHNFFMDELADVMKKLRRIIRLRDPAPAVGLPLIRNQIEKIVETLVSHNAVEEAEVYVWADSFVCPVTKANLEKAIEKELKNLPPRFRRRLFLSSLTRER